MGGGIVPGSLILVGGDPGIGKSTLLLQVCQKLCASKKQVLYISGEESLKQIKLRANRMGEFAEELYLLCETNLEIIKNVIQKRKHRQQTERSIQGAKQRRCKHPNCPGLLPKKPSGRSQQQRIYHHYEKHHHDHSVPSPASSEASIRKALKKCRRLQGLTYPKESAVCKGVSAAEEALNKNTATDFIGCRFITSRNSFYEPGGYSSPP